MLLRDELRGATRAEHEALERALALGRSDLSRDRYIAYLRGWLAFCRSIECEFGAGRELWGLTADCDARIAWLEEDLTLLAASKATGSMPNFGIGINGIPELAGASYVIEGSMLGAQVVYRQLNERWHIEEHEGGSFLWGYGPMSGAHWRRFVAALNDLTLTEDERRRCAVAARSAFRLLDDCLTCNGATVGDRQNPVPWRQHSD